MSIRITAAAAASGFLELACCRLREPAARGVADEDERRSRGRGAESLPPGSAPPEEALAGSGSPSRKPGDRSASTGRSPRNCLASGASSSGPELGIARRQQERGRATPARRRGHRLRAAHRRGGGVERWREASPPASIRSISSAKRPPPRPRGSARRTCSARRRPRRSPAPGSGEVGGELGRRSGGRRRGRRAG